VRLALILLAIAWLGASFVGCAASAPPRGDGEAPFRGATLRYDDVGEPADPSAPAIVLVHGWAGGREAWHKNTPALSAARRVIALDLPGHGESDVVDAPHSMALYAEAIAAVLDDAQVDRAVLIGHSNGTPTVRQFARDYPRRTAGLVAVDGALQDVFPREMAEPMLAQLRGPNYRAFVTQLVTSAQTQIADPADRRLVLDRLDATPQSTIVGALEAALDRSVPTDDPIEVPLLVIKAPNPMMWTPEYEARVRELAEDVEHHTIDGASHFVMMDRPAPFNRLVLDWLAGHGW